MNKIKIFSVLAFLLFIAMDVCAQGYYLVGTMNNWALNMKMTQNTSAETQEYYITTDLSADDEFKVVYSADGKDYTSWFPNTPENYVISADGTYTTCFRPNYDGGEDWYDHCIYVMDLTSEPDEPELKVLFDFEDYGAGTKEFDWGAYTDLVEAANAGTYTDGYTPMLEKDNVANNSISQGIREQVRLVSVDEGKVHSGNYALAYTLDYTQTTDYGEWQYGYLYYWGDPVTLLNTETTQQQGYRLGMWMYIPEEAVGMCSRFAYTYKAANGTKNIGYLYFTYQYVKKGFSKITSEKIPEAGWAYVSVDLSDISTTYVSTSYYKNEDGSLTRDEAFNCAPAFIQWIVSGSAKGAAKFTFYIDDITLDYCAPTEDRDAPVISDITYADGTMTQAAALDGQTATTSAVTFAATAAEDTHNPTGLDASSAKIYVDGLEVSTQFTAAGDNDGTISAAVVLPNGAHDVTFEIADKHGNLARATKSIVVNDPNSDYPVVYAEGQTMNGTDPIMCGEQYKILIKTDKAEAIAGVTTTIWLNSASRWEIEHMTPAPGFSANYELDEASNTATVHITNISSELSGDQTLVSIPVRNFFYDGSSGLSANQQWNVNRNTPILTLSWDVRYGEVSYQDGYAPSVEGYISGFGGMRVDEETELYASFATLINNGVFWHEHTPEPLEDMPATCTTDGFSGRTFCDVCNSVVDWGTTLPATGHCFDVDETTIVLNDTHTEATGEYVCCDCGEREPFETDEVSLYEIRTEDGEVIYKVIVPLNGGTTTVYVHIPCTVLANNADNNTVINDNNGKTIPVQLQGRTLYKDGKWNTICLPFDVTLSGSVLDGAIVKKLDATNSNLSSDGTLTLNFVAETTKLTAGTPYLIRWTSGDHLVNPVFTDVTIDADASTSVNFNGGAFVGTYSPVSFAANTKSILFLGAENKLYWPNADMTLKACRAYFQLNNGAEARAIVLNFNDDEDNTTGIAPLLSPEGDDAGASPRGGLVGASWYDLQGRKLSQKPTTPGLYINKGHKVMVK